MIRMKNPAHPGSFIKSEIIEAHDLTVTDGAKVLGVERQALSELLDCRTSLRADMAIRLQKAFGVSMDTLLRMQHNHELAQAHQRVDTINVQPYQAAAPMPVQPGLL